MSVLIKGMDIPKSCLECITSGLRTAIACAEWTEISAGEREIYRSLSCPLVELPEKHGRLIDESIVLEMIRKSMGIKNLSFLYNAEKSVVNEIYHAPTIIEAEGE